LHYHCRKEKFVCFLELSCLYLFVLFCLELRVSEIV
jgi:hypothetical protein